MPGLNTKQPGKQDLLHDVMYITLSSATGEFLQIHFKLADAYFTVAAEALGRSFIFLLASLELTHPSLFRPQTFTQSNKDLV